jgi:mannose-6-phosphate isomerase-like protein (cupin superfamily)
MIVSQLNHVQPKASVMNVGDVLPKRVDEDHVLRVLSGKVRHWIDSRLQGEYDKEQFCDVRAGVWHVFEPVEDVTVLSFTKTPKIEL